MKAMSEAIKYGRFWVFLVDDAGVPVGEPLVFANEFAAQTYADAINMGVIQHVEA